MTLQAKSVILIVDDTETGREILEALLQSPTYQLAFAANGFDALKQAEALTPDLILLDVMMPVMDGFEVCRRLRANRRLAEIPIILVTALDDRSSRIQGIEAGADDFVTKPFDHAELRARVRTITRLNRYHRLLDERARFEWVVEQADDGYVMLGRRNEVLYANQSARRLLVFSADTTFPTEESFPAYIKQRFRCEPKEAWTSLLDPDLPVSAPQSESPIFLIRPETVTASAQWLEVSLMTQVEGGEVQRLLHLRDVTSQMSTKRDIWTFHSMVMHKLNTPRHAISGGLQLLTPELMENLSPGDIEEVVRLVGSGLERLNSTISDILQYLRMPVSAQATDGFPLQTLEEMAWQIGYSQEISALEVVNHFDHSPSLVLSQQAVECILWELMENAKKFHPQKSPQVSIELLPHPPKAMLLRVTDNGASLTPEQIEKVWLPYYQVEKYFTGEVPGMGLGLTMVAAVLWEVGGACRFRNREDGAGAVVELTIPLLEQ